MLNLDTWSVNWYHASIVSHLTVLSALEYTLLIQAWEKLTVAESEGALLRVCHTLQWCGCGWISISTFKGCYMMSVWQPGVPYCRHMCKTEKELLSGVRLDSEEAGDRAEV